MASPTTLLMPVKNGQKYLKQAIAGLEENCQPEDEILVIDDGSTDETGPLLKKWAMFNPQARVISSPKPGLVEALNFGIQESSKDWIARFDVDDRYDVNRILETKRHIRGDTVCIFSDYEFKTTNGRALGYMPSAVDDNKTYLSLVTSQRTAHPSVCFNKAAAVEVGGYRHKDFPAEDLSLWLRISKSGKIISIPRSFLKYTVSSSSVSGTLRYKSLEKKELLLSSFNFLPESIERGIAEIEESRIFYSNFTHSQERYLLHLRDLALICDKMPNPDSKAIKLIKQKIFREFRNYAPALSLFSQMFLRKIYRKM